jgi:hypothetical protein
MKLLGNNIDILEEELKRILHYEVSEKVMLEERQGSIYLTAAFLVAMGSIAIVCRSL